MSTLTVAASAATVEPSDFAQLIGRAKTYGAVPVVIDLELVSLNSLRLQGDVVRARVANRATKIEAELGAEAWPDTRWSNGIGQHELHVTEKGLELLRGSGNAVSFRPGKQWHDRTAMYNSDGRLQAIEQRLARDGFADVHVMPNVDGLEFNLDAAAGTQLSAIARAAAVAKAGEVLAGMSGRHVLNHAAATAQLASAKSMPASASSDPVLTVRLTREGVAKLAASSAIRAMTLVDHVDNRPTRIDVDAMQAARQHGSAEVIVTLRTPMYSGALSRVSFDAQTRAHRGALQQVLASAQIEHGNWKDVAEFGAMMGRVTAAQLRALQSNKDSRLLSVELNRPMATVSLATSTVTMNMPSAWNAGFRAAGQSIIVMDTGTQANHAFFRNAAGQSRVILEACFGTNTILGGVNYQSRCPSQDANGDSPLGLAGSASPVNGCSSQNAGACAHGTHVAGIAAGRNSSAAPLGVQGVAPDANVIAVQLFSFDSNSVVPPQVFTADIVAAMQAAQNALAADPSDKPHVINLSLGGGQYSAACSTVTPAFSNAVTALRNVGVPVIAATGNDNFSGAVAWPACVPGVIQASSVNNDGVGNTRSTFGVVNGVTKGANLARPSQFPSEYMWLVPGGGGGTVVQSSVPSAAGFASYAGQQGTSQAAPHIAGMYAEVKAGAPGITVNGVSEWINGSASVPVSISLCVNGPCAPTDTVVVRRILVPNF